jgi:uncharacterized protein YgiM (DUF1202 family)
MQRTFTKVLILILLCVVAFSPSLAQRPARASAQTGPYAITNAAVYVRGGPGTGFWILGTLYYGTAVPILNTSPDGGWWYVSAPFGEGWMAKSGATAYNTEAVTVKDPGPMGAIITGAVNVRYGAGINSASLGIMGQGQQVYVLARNADGSWLQIRWEFGTGWVSGEHVSVTGVPGVVDDGSGGFSSAVPLTTDTPYVIVMSAYLNVRTGPGINYAVLGAVAGGDQLPVVGRTADNTWYQVEADFGTGWVYAGYVVARNEYGGSPVTTASAADAEVSGPIGVVNTGALNIRSGPGSQYTSLGVLAGGTETQIVGRTLDWTWWLLDTPVGTGWANAIYIVVRGDTSGVPHVAPGTTVAAEPGQAEAAAPAAEISGPVAFVSTGALNIRSGPNSTFPSLGSVYAGTRMPIIGQSTDHGWWQVESPYGNGWVSKLYVLTEGNTTGIPVVQ